MRTVIASDLEDGLFSSDESVDAEEQLEKCRDLLENILWTKATTINELQNSQRALERHIEERDRLEGELRIAQKLEAVGQLAMGIAHEINTPVQFISDNTHFVSDSFTEIEQILRNVSRLCDALEEGRPHEELLKTYRSSYEEAEMDYLLSEIPGALRQCQEGIDRVQKIVRSMKEFAHPGADEKVNVDINRAIETTVTVATNEWKHVAEVQLDLADQLPPILGLPGEINQVLLNIVVNAAHAIADHTPGSRGTISIATTVDDGFVEIRISDTGGGIPDSIRDKLFEPFFTTKELGRGTGQGLYIAHQVVVASHGGSIKYDSIIGEGTTFTIRLPIKGERGA